MKDMKEKIYVAWRDSNNNSWHPVGLLTVIEDGTFHFVYTKGAFKSNFPLFPRMRPGREYKSNVLFPVFDNRIIKEKRPDFPDYLKWLDIKRNEFSPLKMLSLTEGIKPTDHLEFFQCPVKSAENKYRVLFMMHGLQYLPKKVIERVNDLKEKERLFLALDPQNKWDKNAMMIRTDDPVYTIGYCPRYLNQDFKKLLEKNNVYDVVVSVKKVNKDAPLNFRLLCKIEAPWPEEFRPCDQEDFEPYEQSLDLLDAKDDFNTQLLSRIK
jgi:hypothetical protein